ncbi:MAG: hypothetical protein PUG85_01935 [Oscillospiraceae bacterium]|nr:hypothetical protein [Oscillospiraceae bacterium]
MPYSLSEQSGGFFLLSTDIEEDCNVYGTLMLGYPAQNPYRFVPKRLQPLEMQ